MKINDHTINSNELRRLIDRYFEAETTLEEERMLRRMLAESHDRSDYVEEARAVMGVFACGRHASAGDTAPAPRRRRRPSLLLTVSAAASIAVIFGAVLALTKVPAGVMSPSGKVTVAHELEHGADDSLDMLAYGDKDNRTFSYHTMAVASHRVNDLSSDDDIANVIGTEMGYMAEAEREVYESIADDFGSLAGVMQ